METTIVVHANKQRTKVTVYSSQATTTIVVDESGNVSTKTEPPHWAGMT